MDKSELFDDVFASIESISTTVANSVTQKNSDLDWTEDPEPYEILQRILSTSDAHKSAVQKVIAESLRAMTVAIFSTIDGDTRASESGRVFLKDKHGDDICESLHDEFIAHLVRKGFL